MYEADNAKWIKIMRCITLLVLHCSIKRAHVKDLEDSSAENVADELVSKLLPLLDDDFRDTALGTGRHLTSLAWKSALRGTFWGRIAVDAPSARAGVAPFRSLKDPARRDTLIVSGAHAKPRSTLTSTSEDELPLQAFHKWLVSRGVNLSAVQGQRLPSFGVSLVAQTDCSPGDVLLTVPASLHISPGKVKASPIGQAIDGVIPADDDSAILALGLLAEFAKGEVGEFWPYLSILPNAADMVGQPLLWSENEIKKNFNGSHLCETITGVKGGLSDQWKTIEERVLPNNTQLFPRHVFNLQGYLYAHAIVQTRALPFGEDLTLIPFLDLANHAKGAANTCSIGVAKAGDGDGTKSTIASVTSQDQLTAMGVGKEVMAVLTAGSPLAKGQQAFIDYGEAGWRSSWEMLYTYGFVLGSSPAEWLAAGGRPVFFDGVSKTDQLFQQKLAMLVALGGQHDAADGTWVDLQPRADQCMMMAPLMRLGALEDDGTEPLASDLAQWKADPNELWGKLQEPLSDRTEAKVAAQVLKTCREALQQLPSADELLPAAADEKGTSPETVRARLAARVLLGERAALEMCVTVWEKVKPHA